MPLTLVRDGLVIPRIIAPAPRPPSYVYLDMALGLGEGATLFDKSRFRAHGAITGASWATGLHGKCLDFDPTIPSYVEIPAAKTQLNFTSENFSIVVRIKVDSLTVAPFVFSRGAWVTDGYLLYISTSGRVIFYTFQSGKGQYTQSGLASIVVETYYTIGVSRDGASVRLYKNGIDINVTPGTHQNPATSSRSAKIGISDGKVTNPTDGKMEFLRVFGGIALSASEHLAYHNALA